MFRTNLKIAIRVLLRHKNASVTNIAGLALGLTCAALMLLFITFELSYDRFNERSSRIHRLTQELRRGDRLDASAVISQSVAINGLFPEVEKAGRLFTYSWMEEALVAFGEKSFFEQRFFLADPSIFAIFSFEAIRGDLGTALVDPDGLVISESAARRYFGEDDPLGKVLSVRNLRRSDLKITAVIRDLPKNSHFHCDFIAPMAAGENLFWDGFEERNSSYVYLLLKENVSPDVLERKIDSVLSERAGGEDWSLNFRLQPLSSIHLRSHLSGEIEPNGSVKTVSLLAFLAFVVLLVSAINFVNLATARSVGRAREVGLKKVVGAGRSDLVRQFLTEAVLFAALALPLALLLVQAFLPAFNRLLDTELSLIFPGHGWFFAGTLLLTVLLGLLSGIYPALVVSRFAPVFVFKGRSSSSGQGAPVRRALVVLQFSASVVLLIAASVVFTQLRYVRSRELGFQRKDLVILPVKDYETVKSYDLLKTAFLRTTAVESVTASEGLPSRFRRTHAVWHEGLSGEEDVSLAAAEVDFDFLETYGIRMASGRDFAETFATDAAAAYVINETAARTLGWSEPLGKKIQLSNRGLMRSVYVPGEVVGVVGDFHFQSLHEPIRPLVLKIGKGRITHVAVRIAPGKTLLALDFLAARWREILPGRPFDFFFFDDDFGRLYRDELRTGKIFAASTALSILIAGLGVFGLASFRAAQRTKEIGIRRVLGAAAGSIVWMFSKDFGGLVLLANAIAWPAAYLLMSRWILGFAYRAAIGIWIFLGAAGFSLFVALATSGGLALKAAFADPVESLRYE